jgi:hypothetical protein
MIARATVDSRGDASVEVELRLATGTTAHAKDRNVQEPRFRERPRGNGTMVRSDASAPLSVVQFHHGPEWPRLVEPIPLVGRIPIGDTIQITAPDLRRSFVLDVDVHAAVLLPEHHDRPDPTVLR